MAKLSSKVQKELDDATDSLGGGTIRPPKRRAGAVAKPRSGKRKASRVGTGGKTPR